MLWEGGSCGVEAQVIRLHGAAHLGSGPGPQTCTPQGAMLVGLEEALHMLMYRTGYGLSPQSNSRLRLVVPVFAAQVRKSLQEGVGGAG